MTKQSIYNIEKRNLIDSFFHVYQNFIRGLFMLFSVFYLMNEYTPTKANIANTTRAMIDTANSSTNILF